MSRTQHRKDNNHADLMEEGQLLGLDMIDTSQTSCLLDAIAQKPRAAYGQAWYLEFKTGASDKLSEREAKFILAHPQWCRIIRTREQMRELAAGKLLPDSTVIEANQRLYWKEPRF